MDKGKEFCQILLSVLFFLKRPPKKLVGQSLSAFVATTFQHVSACRRSHSLTETVYLALLSLFGLISSFHNTFSCIWFFFFFVFWWLSEVRPQQLFHYIAKPQSPSSDFNAIFFFFRLICGIF